MLALRGHRRLPSRRVSAVSYDYKSKYSVALTHVGINNLSGEAIAERLGRGGQGILNLHGAGNLHQEPPDFDCWPLDDTRFLHLVGEAEADAVINALHETQPDLFDAQSPAANHACVKRHLAIATRNGIDSAGARRHFAMLALSLDDDFSTHPALQTLLKRTREGADYSAEVAALPADFWQRTERKN